jgi:ABC-type glycerol-3-phosphate transport system substrate-binding protein
MGRPNDGEVYICVTPQNYEVTGNDPAEPYKTETFIDKPYAKAYYKKLNAAFQAGLIKESTFTMSFDQYIAEISSGVVLGMFDQAWDFGTASAALSDAGMFDRTYVALDLVYDPADVNGVEIVPNDDQKIMDLLKELWATGDTQKVADGVLGAEFIWQEDLNKIPGLNTMVKQDLDLIQSVGMLEAVKSIL